MAKLINLTVRVDDDQKKAVDIACEYLGTSISDVVRHALGQTIDQYRKKHVQDTEYARLLMQGSEAQQAYNLIKEFMALNGGKLSMGADGKLKLNGKFIPNED